MDGAIIEEELGTGTAGVSVQLETVYVLGEGRFKSWSEEYRRGYRFLNLKLMVHEG